VTYCWSCCTRSVVQVAEFVAGFMDGPTSGRRLRRRQAKAATSPSATAARLRRRENRWPAARLRRDHRAASALPDCTPALCWRPFGRGCLRLVERNPRCD
jgi:hypothetical protein